jgi:leucyl aminopeptidase (aminopeptidase T)
MNPLRIADLMEGAHNCAVNWGNVKKGDQVLIVTDTACDFGNAEAIAAVCREVGAIVTTMVIPPQSLPNQEPPAPVAAAMLKANVVFMPLYYTISHTDARFAATNEAGVSVIGMYASTTTDALASDGAKFPAEIIYLVSQKVADQWRRGKRIHITCERGTDVTGEIRNPDENIVGWAATAGPIGTSKEGEGSWLNKFGNFAGGFGVVGLWPEWTANGVMYYEAAHTFKGYLREPLKFVIKDGYVVEMDGPHEVVDFFRKLPDRFGKDALHIGEFMIGLNPWTRIYLDDGTHMEAHRHAGALHTCVGMSVDRDRTVNPGIHLDQYIQRPTIYIDDEVCVDNGRLMVYYNDPDVLALLDKYDIKLD